MKKPPHWRPFRNSEQSDPVEPGHVIRYPFGNGFELGVITHAAQLGHISLGEALIATLEVIREGNVLNGSLLMMLDHRFGHVLERLGTASTTVEDAGVLRVLPEPEVYLADVVDIDEVTHLATVREAIATFEQLGILALLHLGIEVEGEIGRAHV